MPHFDRDCLRRFSTKGRWPRTTFLAPMYGLLLVANHAVHANPSELTFNHTLPTQPQHVPPSPLALTQAIAWALDNHPELRVARQEIAATQAQLMQANARPNPELAYELEDTRAQSRVQSIQITQAIEMGDKRKARHTVATLAHEIAVAALSQRTQDIRAATATAFYNTLIAQEHVKLAQTSVELAAQAAEAAAKRVAAGKAPPVESTKANLAKVAAAIERSQAQAARDEAKAGLASAMGTEALTFSDVMGPLDAPITTPPETELTARLAQAPALRRARLEIAYRNALVGIERSKQTPDVTLSVGVQRDQAAQRNQLLLGFSIPLPLFDRNQGHLLEATKREDKAKDELSAVATQITAQLNQAKAQVNSARIEIDLLMHEVLPSAQNAYRTTTTGYEHGKFSFIDVLDSQRTYFSAQSQHLKAWAQAQRAAVELNRILGVFAPNPNQ